MSSKRDWNWIRWRGGGITKMSNNDSWGSYFTRQVGTRDTNWSWWWYNHVVEHSLGGTVDWRLTAMDGRQWNCDQDKWISVEWGTDWNDDHDDYLMESFGLKKDRIPSGTSAGLEWNDGGAKKSWKNRNNTFPFNMQSIVWQKVISHMGCRREQGYSSKWSWTEWGCEIADEDQGEYSPCSHTSLGAIC